MANFDALKAPTGYLKIVHVVLGIVAIGIIGYYTSKATPLKQTGILMVTSEGLFFLMVTFAFLVTSFVLLVSLVLDDSSEITKSLFEILYHLLGFIFYFSASIALLVLISGSPKEARNTAYALHVIAAVCGLVNSVAYAACSFLGYKSRSN